MKTITLYTQDLLAIASRIDTMRKLEKQVRRLNMLACNKEMSPGQENRRMRLEAEFTDLAKSFGLFAEHQRDPRGSALRLHDRYEDIESGVGVSL